MSWGNGNPPGGALTIEAPETRQVCQHTGTIASTITEIDALREWQRKVADALGVSEGPGQETGGLWFCADAEQAARYAAEGRAAVGHVDELAEKLTNTRYELDDQATLLRRTNELNADLAKWAETYQTERDDYRDEVDGERDRADGFAATIDDLEAENAELRQKLAAAESARDTANARASL